MLKDIQYAARVLLKNPGFTAVAVLALALGIGANTAIFSVVDAVLLRPLPYDEPDRLVKIVGRDTVDGSLGNLSPADFQDFARETDTFESAGAHGWVGFFTITVDGEAERIGGSNITLGFLPTLGVEAVRGRLFRPEEDAPGGERVTVVSDAFWHRRFGGAPDVVGRVITVDANPTTIIGVLPPGYRHPEPNLEREPEIYVPYRFSPVDASRGGHFIRAIGRLKDGVPLDEAQAEWETIAARLEAEYPEDNTNQSVAMSWLFDAIVGTTRPALILLLGAVGFVLLVACANIANLLLAKGANRQKELAVRAALGAGRWRLIRQLLTESVLLSLLGGATGLIIAGACTELLMAFASSSVPRTDTVGLNGTVISFTMAIAAGAGTVFGLAPALQLSRLQVVDSLKVARGSESGGAPRATRSALIAAEVALSLVLLVGLLAAVGLSCFLGSLMFEVTPTDPVTYVTVALILVAVALAACYVPARRAASVDPMAALRVE